MRRRGKGFQGPKDWRGVPIEVGSSVCVVHKYRVDGFVWALGTVQDIDLSRKDEAVRVKLREKSNPNLENTLFFRADGQDRYSRGSMMVLAGDSDDI